VDGILLRFTVQDAPEAALNDGQTLLAFNDLFIGARSHVSARLSPMCNMTRRKTNLVKPLAANAR
jgi:hypothetical protein